MLIWKVVKLVRIFKLDGIWLAIVVAELSAPLLTAAFCKVQ